MPPTQADWNSWSEREAARLDALVDGDTGLDAGHTAASWDEAAELWAHDLGGEG